MTQQNQQRQQPLAKGRACVVVDQYQAKDQTNGNLLFNADQTPMMKNRYGTIGPAIMWPSKEGEIHPNVTYTHELNPAYQGAYKVYFFWDAPAQQPAQQAPQQQAPQQQGYPQNTQQYNRK